MNTIDLRFEDHLWCVVRNLDEKITIQEVVEEWDWWVEENKIVLNKQAYISYTKALLTCNGYIED